MRALIVEDHVTLRSAVGTAAREAGFAVDEAGDGEDGLWHATSFAYDAIVLDIMLPKLDGLEVLRRLRAAGSQAPVLLLTARDGVEDRVAGLDAGADDYLAKPFAMSELLARLRALARRGAGRRERVLRLGRLAVDTVARSVAVDGKALVLTTREFAILETLAQRHGEVVARADLWERCYDAAAEPNSNVIDVYVGYLRRKLERAGLAGAIRTVRGAGYVLEPG
jgi:DNA-binding response OmpR family regulator